MSGTVMVHPNIHPSIHLSVHSSCLFMSPAARHPHLRNAVDVDDHLHDVVQRQQGVALELCVDILALGAGGQQLHQRVVVSQCPTLLRALTLTAHHLEQQQEGRAVIVEHQHVLATVYQLGAADTKEHTQG